MALVINTLIKRNKIVIILMVMLMAMTMYNMLNWRIIIMSMGSINYQMYKYTDDYDEYIDYDCDCIDV